MRIDQNKPKSLNPWINHWHSNHKASHFAVVVLFVNHHLECLHIYEERTSNWIFFINMENILISFKSKICFYSVPANAPENGNKKAENSEVECWRWQKNYSWNSSSPLEWLQIIYLLIAIQVWSEHGMYKFHRVLSPSLTRFNFPSNIFPFFSCTKIFLLLS